ncbi:MAG: DUF501 domain-containing protein [Acidimicrobiales bacterium]
MTVEPSPSVTAEPPSPDADRVAVTRLLGRAPQGEFEVVVRRDDGSPVVVANAPLLETGRPMPTRFWLVDRALTRAAGTLESEGGVKRAEAEIDPALIRAAHDRYAAERDTLVDPGHDGPRPSGGVGGTRTGVKCLHAHLANHLAGHDDPVGAWVVARLAESGHHYDPSEPGA